MTDAPILSAYTGVITMAIDPLQQASIQGMISSLNNSFSDDPSVDQKNGGTGAGAQNILSGLMGSAGGGQISQMIQGALQGIMGMLGGLLGGGGGGGGIGSMLSGLLGGGSGGGIGSIFSSLMGSAAGGGGGAGSLVGDLAGML
jgi:hypothetical protein